MSVVDELRGLEARVIDRIHELEDAVSELAELKKVAKRLGIDTSKPRQRKTTSTARRSRRATPGTATQRKSAPSRPRSTRGGRAGSSRRDDVLSQVMKHPGSTVAEIGKHLGVDPTGLYRVVNKLESDGAVKRDAGKLTIA
ncbi:MAG: Sugar-specific transcriptional regulator TrmB [Thermoleophilaceae bacterium]|jgi:hypothetical protein|nr:Sugar-specific transcriptional regulator TrmB [Thermoleophilaceae bacterium]